MQCSMKMQANSCLWEGQPEHIGRYTLFIMFSFFSWLGGLWVSIMLLSFIIKSVVVWIFSYTQNYVKRIYSRNIKHNYGCFLHTFSCFSPLFEYWSKSLWRLRWEFMIWHVQILDHYHHCSLNQSTFSSCHTDFQCLIMFPSASRY